MRQKASGEWGNFCQFVPNRAHNKRRLMLPYPSRPLWEVGPCPRQNLAVRTCLYSPPRSSAWSPTSPETTLAEHYACLIFPRIPVGSPVALCWAGPDFLPGFHQLPPLPWRPGSGLDSNLLLFPGLHPAAYKTSITHELCFPSHEVTIHAAAELDFLDLKL